MYRAFNAEQFKPHITKLFTAIRAEEEVAQKEKRNKQVPESLKAVQADLIRGSRGGKNKFGVNPKLETLLGHLFLVLEIYGRR